MRDITLGLRTAIAYKVAGSRERYDLVVILDQLHLCMICGYDGARRRLKSGCSQSTTQKSFQMWSLAKLCSLDSLSQTNKDGHEQRGDFSSGRRYDATFTRFL